MTERRDGLTPSYATVPAGPNKYIGTHVSPPHLDILPLQTRDLAPTTNLHCQAFGPGRFARTAYRVREGLQSGETEEANACSRVGWIDDTLAASVTMTPITIGGSAGAMLLGPLVVAPDFAGQGFGQPMVKAALAAAKDAGAELVLLVGDHAYYTRFGFDIVREDHITLPGPVNLDRVLAVELTTGALAKFQGLISADNASITH